MLAEITFSGCLFPATVSFRRLAINPWTATLLLILLQDEPSHLRPPEETAVYFQALKDNAQLLDLYTVDGNWGRFEHEVGWCQRHFRRCHGMPPMSDIRLLPPDEVIEARMEFNRKLHVWLQDQRYAKLYDYRRYTDLADENERLYGVMAAMMQAKRHISRHAIGDISIQLGVVRELVGWEAYYSGRWSPHVPLAAFEQR